MPPIEFEQLQAKFETAAPQEILKWAVDTYQRQLILVTSFQPTGIATLHMLKEITDDMQVLTLDTNVLFPETYDLMKQVEDTFDIEIIRLQPEITLEQQAAQYGDELWKTNSDLCCDLRKSRSLKRVLHHYRAWITGLRRDQSASRSDTPIVSWNSRFGIVKICPFATWTEDMIWTYIDAHELPYNPLHDNGYPSIGCTHCTIPVMDGDDIRSGRWANTSKTECGIHLDFERATNESD